MSADGTPSPPPETPCVPPRTVILWVIPRSTSTMFECAMLQRADFRVLHEPLGDAFYFSKEKVSKRFPPVSPDMHESTFAKIWGDMVHPAAGETRRTFSKDMAQYIFRPRDSPSSKSGVPSLARRSDDDEHGNPTLIPSHLLLDPTISHTFLIRSPVKAVPSYYRLCTAPGNEGTGFEYYDPEEAGYHELRQLHDFLREQGQDPLVIESENLLKDPEGVMKMWCQEVGIEFDEKMLSWETGTRGHFAKWGGFHTCAEQSTGMGKGLKAEHLTPSNHTSSKKSPPHPPIVLETIEANMGDYHYLSSFVRSK